MTRAEEQADRTAHGSPDEGRSDPRAEAEVEIASLRLPRRTTPTWEIELLISGALVFSLFQVVTPLDQAFARWINVVPPVIDPWIIYSHLYAKVVVFILIGTFVAHLSMRAYWVSLVGVHSIYPRGIQWENLRGSKAAIRVMRRRSCPMPESIERADNRASLVFALGIVCAQFGLLIYGWTMVAVATGWLVAWLYPETQSYALFVVIGAGVGLMLLITVLDRIWIARLEPDAPAARAAERFYGAMSRWMGGAWMQQLFPLISTNIAGKRGVWVVILGIYLALGVVSLHTVAGRIDIPFLKGGTVPSLRRDAGLHPEHYLDEREGLGRWSGAPWIPSKVVQGPYLELFVPFVADRHDAAIAAACKLPETGGKDEAEKVANARAYEQAWSDCLGGLLSVAIEDRAPRPMSFNRQRDGQSGHDGLLVMIDVRDLGPGRYVVGIKRLPREAGAFGRGEKDEQQRDRILFWR